MYTEIKRLKKVLGSVRFSDLLGLVLASFTVVKDKFKQIKSDPNIINLINPKEKGCSPNAILTQPL